MPAKPNGSPPRRRMWWGAFLLCPGTTDHSKKPVAGTTQRWRARAVLNRPLVATVSARALIGGGALPGVIQAGWKPHPIAARGRPARWPTTTGITLVGAAVEPGITGG